MMPPMTEPPQRSSRLVRLLRNGTSRRGLVSGLTTSSVVGAAGIVAFGFIGSRLLGLLRSVAIADAFGTDPELGAYWVAFRLPDLVFQVLAGATLSAAFIPTYSRIVRRDGDEAGWRLASSVLNVIAVATTVAAVVAFLLAPLIVPLLAPGLGEEAGREEELRDVAVKLTRIMLISPILFGVSGMVTGILNARQHFWAPALAPMIYNLAIIFGAVVLADRWGTEGLAAGVVIGSAGHLLVQLPALWALGMKWRPTLNLASEGVREVARLMGPRVLGLAAAQINLVVVIFFASFVSDAAISAVSYAFLMALLPVGIIGMAIATAAFPTLAQRAASEDTAGLRVALGGALRVILFLAIPASVGLALLAEPGTRLLLQRGAFDADSTSLVVDALVIYALGVFAHSSVEILSRGFYALSDTRTPVAVAIGGMLVNVGLCAALVAPFGIGGLAAATTVAAIAEFVVLLQLLDRRLGGITTPRLGRSLIRTGVATALMAAAIALLRLALDEAGVDLERAGSAAVVAVVAGGGGLLTFFMAAWALRSEEIGVLRRRSTG